MFSVQQSQWRPSVSSSGINDRSEVPSSSRRQQIEQRTRPVGPIHHPRAFSCRSTDGIVLAPVREIRAPDMNVISGERAVDCDPNMELSAGILLRVGVELDSSPVDVQLGFHRDSLAFL